MRQGQGGGQALGALRLAGGEAGGGRGAEEGDVGGRGAEASVLESRFGKDMRTDGLVWKKEMVSED